MKEFLEFNKDGKLNATVEEDGKDLTFDGTYKLDGSKLTLKLLGEEDKQVLTVISLTKAGLITTDEKEKKETYIRTGDNK
ncbi:MAG TPA: lipocalin family protein [Urbifossiella sp.]|nr:lipocalin family protein [Urbifossiella sp.]